MRILLCLTAFALGACNLNLGGNNESPKPQPPASFLQQAINPGTYPDGSKAEALTDNQQNMFFDSMMDSSNLSEAVAVVSQHNNGNDLAKTHLKWVGFLKHSRRNSGFDMSPT